MTTPSLTIRPVLGSADPPSWDGAVWIGDVWLEAVHLAEHQARVAGVAPHCRLENADGYTHARLLVRAPGRALGFIEVDVRDGEVDFSDLRCNAMRVAASWAGSEFDEAGRDGHPARSVSVVICTRDRPALLRSALESVLALDFGEFEAIVVDNAPSTDATRDYVLGLSDPRVRLVEEPYPGVSRARNAGLLAATGDVVAFIDDDVVVDRHWLRMLLNGFDRAESVSCVSGMVPAGEIRTRAQAEFDRRVGWSASTVPRTFDWLNPPDDVPLFPFAVGVYGTGANFAVDRRAACDLGGFDENLGAGVPTCGGEDLDIFFRILQSGRQLVHEPAAIAWHRHRADNEALSAQVRGYGLGLGAWLAKIVGNPVTAWLAVKTAVTRAPAFVRHMGEPSQELPPGLLVKGAWRYRRARHAPDLPTPLLSAKTSVRQDRKAGRR